VRGYDTSGTYAQVRGGSIDLRVVNAALRKAVIADQRAYTPYARKEREALDGPNGPSWAHRLRGVYRTYVDRRLVSASTVVVSALLPAVHQVFRGQPASNSWLSITVHVPSGQPVAISDLFADPARGLGVLGTAWRAELRRRYSKCADIYLSLYRTDATYFRQFALTAAGLAAGVGQMSICPRFAATVRYSVLRPYLSKLGARLIAGVRKPR